MDMKKDFKFNKEDLKFWRNQTEDLKNKTPIDEIEDIIFDSSELDNDFMELKASSEELLKFREIKIEDMSTLPDLELDKNASGLDKNTNKKFKTGKMPIEATLDMHGMTQDQAFKAMISFINSSYERGLRFIVIVTGKGFFSKKGMGVLRKSVPVWINNPDIRFKILSFSQALPKDGGNGAYYIFLKKNK